MAKLGLIPLLLLAAVSSRPAKADDSLTGDAIMARVATNQDNSQKLRSQYIYHQHIHVISKKPGGKVRREETADYHVVPKPGHTERTLEQITGRYWHKGKYEAFSGEPVPDSGSTGGELIHDFRDDVTGEKSKDGLAHDLFPLTTEEQKDYKFRLIDRELFEGRQAYHIAFTPKDDENTDWAGEAYIDALEFQPVYLFTKLSQPLPFGVRKFLGTDLPGIGFAVHYRRQEVASGFLPAWERIWHSCAFLLQSHDDGVSGKQGLRAHACAEQDHGRGSIARQHGGRASTPVSLLHERGRSRLHYVHPVYFPDIIFHQGGNHGDFA